MRKMFKVGLLVCIITLLSYTSISIGDSTPSTTAEGLWQYTPFIDEVRIANGNTFLSTHEIGVWTGTLQGESTEVCRVTIYFSGKWSVKGLISFESVSVNGKSGGLEMSFVGKRLDGISEWEGKWVILSGTGELETLHGQGTWWGPGAPGVGQKGDIYYSGSIHFES